MWSRLSRHGGIDERVRKVLAVIVAVAMVTSGLPTQALAEALDELDGSEPVAIVADEEQQAQEETQAEEEAPAEEPAGEEDPAEEQADEPEPARVAPEPDVDAATELVMTPEAQAYTPGADGTSAEELLDAYARQRLDEALPADAQEGPARVAPEDPTESMTELDRNAFELLRAQIKLIAAGEETSTEVTLRLSELTDTYSWTADELGVDAIVADGQVTEEAWQAATARCIPNIDKVIDALIVTCPYALYWYDKAADTVTTPSFGIEYSETEVSVPDGGDATITVSLPVAAAYAGDDPYTMVSELPEKIGKAVDTAQGIVDANEGLPAYDRLAAYKDEICDLVEYDYDAAYDDSTPYGDPWQLISVFDGDGATNVVCEGYAKAFKYLCDLSDKRDATAITVTGDMGGGTGAGGHMWNVVKMDDGNNYLVDVTNCDEGSVGHNSDGGQDYLFVAIPSSGDVDSGYTFMANESSINYRYDADEYDNMFTLYGEDAITLASEPYDPNNAIEPEDLDLADALVELEEGPFTYSGDEICPEVTVTYDGEELEEGTHYTVSYENNVGSSDGETTATVTITAIEGSGYTGSQEVTFTIEPGEQPSEGTITSGAYQIAPANLDEFESEHNYASEADITWTYIDEGAENGFRVTFDEQTMLEDGYDYLHVLDAAGEEIASYTGGELAGATIDIPSPGQFTFRLTSDGSATGWGFKVSDVQHLAAANDLSRATVTLSQTVFKFDGSAHEPAVTVLDADGNELAQDTHYTVSYADNIELGEATVTVTAIDGSGYTGLQTVTFEINETGNQAGGTFGGVAWSIDTEGTLVLEPTEPEEGSECAAGELPAYGYGSWPWRDDAYCDLVTSVEVREGVTAGEEMLSMFAWLSNATSMDLSGLNTSRVTNMDYLFQGCSSLASLDLSGFDTANVTGMEGMFDGCSALESLDVAVLDTSNVTRMDYMFYNCSSLTSLDLAEFETGSVTSIRYMFGDCSALTELDLSNFDTSRVDHLDNLFYNCSSLTSLDLSSFDISGVAILFGVFQGCSSLETLNLSSFVTSQVSEFDGMFSSCDSLTELVLGPGYVVQGEDMVPYSAADYGRWWSTADHRWYTQEGLAAARSSIATAKADTLTTTAEPGYEHDLSAADVTVHNLSRADALAGVLPEVIVEFEGEPLEEGVDFTLSVTTDLGANTGTVTVTSMGIYTGSTMAGFKITDHGERAGGALGEGDVSWRIGYDGALTIAPDDGVEGTFLYEAAEDEEGDPDDFEMTNRWPWAGYRFDITSVTVEGTVHATGSLTDMFFECSSSRVFDLAGLETSGVTSMASMFKYCSRATTLDLSGFDTAQVTSFDSMFAYDHRLATLDLSSFDLTAASDPQLFRSNDALAELKVGPLFVVDSADALPEPTTANGKWWSDAAKAWLTVDQIVELRGVAEGRVADTFRTVADAAHVNDLSGAVVVVQNLSRAKADAGEMPEVTVTLNGQVLTQDTDYTLANAVEGDTGTVTVTSMGSSYTGSTTASYAINEHGERTGGTVGESDVSWRLAYDGTLTIAPTNGVSGTLPSNDDQESGFWPWYEWNQSITSVVVDGNVRTGSDASNLFGDLNEVKTIDLGGLDTSGARCLSYLFGYDYALEQLDVSSLDTSQCTDFSWMFSGCESLESIGLETLNTVNATDMRGMFAYSANLAGLDLTPFETSNVTNMGYLFAGCDSLVSLDLSMLDMGEVTSVEGMFEGCDVLTSLVLPESFTAQRVDSLMHLFEGCSSLASLDLSHLDTRDLADRFDPGEGEYEYASACEDMFRGCGSLTEITVGEHYALGDADAFPDATSPNGLWWSAAAEQWLTKDRIINERNCIADTYTNVAGEAGAFDLTGAVLEVNNQVYTGEALTPEVVVWLNNELVDPSVYDVAYAQNTDFGDATVTVTARQGSGYTGSATATFAITKHGGEASGTIGTCDWWVSYDGVLTIAPSEGEVGQLPSNSRGWGFWPWQDEYDHITSARFEGTVVAAKNASCLFAGLEEVRTIDCTGLDTSAVTNMRSMFENCMKLESIDLSSFDTQNVTNMCSVFAACHALKSLDLSGFDTSHVTAMIYMFGNCQSLTELDLTSFDTSAVETTSSSYEEDADSIGFESMFFGCSSLASLDLSSFDTSSTCTATGGKGLFEQCDALASIAVGAGYVMNDYTIPEPTADQGWFSTADGAWYTTAQLKDRSGIADTYCNEGSVDQIDIQTADVVLEEGPFTYTGSAVKPQVTVTYEGTPLVEDTDYTLEYANNTDAGGASVTVHGLGAYAGTLDLGFAIDPATLADGMVEVDDSACTFTGSELEPKVTVTFGDKTLKRTTDYTIACANNVMAGDGATVTVTGTGNYAGEVTRGFSIHPASLATAVVSAPTQTYSGSPLTPEPTVLMGGAQLAKGTDYEVVGYSENTSAGERAKVTVRGLGNYTGEATGTFVITPASLSEALVGARDMTYTGQALKPEPTVVLGSTFLTANTDYTVAYESNVDAGPNARVIVTGTGNYAGEASATFTISPAQITGIDPIASASYQDGSPVKPKLTVRAGSLTLGDGDYDATYENNTELGATATVTVTGKGNFAGTASTTFTITETLDDPTAEGSVLNELTKAYDDAVDAAEQAAADVVAKQEALEQAKAAKQGVEEAYQALVDAVDAAQEELTAAQGELAQKQEALEAAQAAKGANDAAIEEAQQTKDAADADVAAKQGAVESAQAAQDAAEQAVAEAQEAVEAKQAALDAALAAAEVKKAKGSIGFFESVGATAAADVLKRSALKTLPQQGDPDDAIALDNMKDSFQWLKYHNQLRTSLGLSELKVSDLLMAYAQADADYSDTVRGHAQQFRDTSVTGGTYGENVAWNYGSNPYAQWYDGEKAYFDAAYRSITGAAAGSEPTGVQAYNWYEDHSSKVEQYLNENLDGVSVDHYTNDINPNFVTTGFAICTRGTMSGWQTDCQFFGGNIDAYTVDAYEARFMEYYDSLQCTAEKAALKAAQDELDVREAALEEAQAALEAAQAAHEAAVATAAEAADTLEELQGKTAGLEAAVASAEQEKAAAAQVVAGKQATYDDAVSARDAYDYENKLAAANAAIATAQQELDDARDAKDAADAAVITTKERLSSSCDLSQATVLGANDVTYTGSQQKPAVVVHLTMQGATSTETYQLTEGTDYTVSYGENTSAGTASVTVTAKEDGRYAGSKTVEFTIKPAQVTGIDEIASVRYAGVPATPAMTVRAGDLVLRSGDYTATYQGNDAVGTATATVTGKGNFAGTASRTFKVVGDPSGPDDEGSVYHELADAVDEAEAKVEAAEQKVQDAEDALADAQAAAAADPSNQGLQDAVTAAENALSDAQTEEQGAKHDLETATAARDAALDLSNATVSGVTPSFVYDGTVHEQPDAVVAIELTSGAISDRYTLAEGTDYTVSYANTTEVGTATMTITAKPGSRYTGSKTVTFAITKRPTVITAADKTLTGPSSVALGAKVAEGAGTLSYASSNSRVARVDATGKVTAVSAGTAKVTVSAAASDTYAAASKTVTVTVRKAANPLVAKAKKATAKVKYKKVKKKKQTVKNLVVSGQQGTVSYKLVKAKKTKKWKINAKTGAITVPKKTKKGTYKLTVQVTAAGNGLHDATTKTVTFKVKVK